MTVHTGGQARLVYLGSPAIAVPPLEALVEAGHDVALVVTNPDRRRGRGKQLHPTPVKAAAERLGLAVSHELDDVLSVDADLGIVVAFGHIIGNHVLEALPLVNIHFSLLPRWRGAAPLERAILAGDTETGVCLMQIVEALDEGDVYARTVVPIGDATLPELQERLVEASCDLLIGALEHGFVEPEPQQGEPLYARKIKPEEHRLDWDRPAAELQRVVRLGRAWTTIDGKRLRVLEAGAATDERSERPGTLSVADGVVATGGGSLRLERVQPEGRKAVSATDWLRGARLEHDPVLGE